MKVPEVCIQKTIITVVALISCAVISFSPVPPEIKGNIINIVAIMTALIVIFS
jgi:hypothetical protein